MISTCDYNINYNSREIIITSDFIGGTITRYFSKLRLVFNNLFLGIFVVCPVKYLS